ncbi:3-oxoacyl-ACP synthase III family protein [Histidinibacterium lentulum]|uniref:Ketoacyl-ACP synthase III n=1 Tax=Histidinibacterium lentulum TaxID=2480588 RepID=A0A3N2R921_9RHOB|nr:ketoacyl-ACP synthase III [Histidinibacterium lentulum]ROU03913.1 ketoacyl-ACP synthase III [Histidinibacterium lentulum]
MATASILGTGRAASLAPVASATLDRYHDLPPGHVAEATGVHLRPRAIGRDQVELAAEAGRAALADAGLEAGRLDAILHAAAVPYQTIPATAPLVQLALGLGDGAVAAYDVGATCLGFLAALQHAAAMVETGRWSHVLVVASEKVSDNLDWRDPATAGLFGDGAGAAVVGSGAGGLRLGPIALSTHPSGYEAAGLPAGGTRLGALAPPHALHFAMDGPALFALTRRRFGAFVSRTLEQAGLTMEEIDLVLPHQASPAALRLMVRALKVPEDRLVDLSATHGNQVAASLPVTLDHARREGRIAPGARVLMLGTAAGVTFGAGILEAAPCG